MFWSVLLFVGGGAEGECEVVGLEGGFWIWGVS